MIPPGSLFARFMGGNRPSISQGFLIMASGFRVSVDRSLFCTGAEALVFVL